ncbi:hypothetical protein AB0K09_00415 [Streptomyces sp. NPDC049577]|uniref:hypothetical protein n=1 Tax=Streptomyces sp. NPDC049577 TaxID=3155153 RepID=UPI003423E339
MPSAGDQLPGGANAMMRRLATLEREVKELRAARRLTASAISGGDGLTVRNATGGPSVRVTADAGGIAFLTAQQAAILISSGLAEEAQPGIVTAYADSGGVPFPVMVLMCPDVDEGVASVVMQGGTPGGSGPIWQAAAGSATLTINETALGIVLAAAGFTFDASGAYFTGEAWTALTLASGWTAFGSTYQSPIFMKKLDGMVQLAGLMAPGTTANGTTVATLPTGYRPAADHVFKVSAGAAGAHADVYVRSSGALQIQNTVGTIAWLSLSGIRFPL